MDPQLELVDRQVTLLLKRSDPLAFLWLIEPFLASLQSDPVLATLIEDILEDVANVVGAMEEADRELAVELGALRAEFAELAPAAAFESTLALFDELAEAEPAAFTAEGVGGRAAPLLAVPRELDADTRPTGPGSVRSPEDQLADPLAAWRASRGSVLHRYFRALRSMRAAAAGTASQPSSRATCSMPA
ncbi:MAG: hypothetical protein ABSH51_05985 [Solirubrobacteraceae bacterium]|jgi:hypothetical protein